MPTISVANLMNIVRTIFTKAGATREESDLLADALVSSNLSGVDSHGVILIGEYLRLIKAGQIKPGNKPKLIKETPTTALFDGNNSWGYVAAKKAMEVAIEKAKKQGVAVVMIKTCNHIGRLGYYTLMAAKENMIGYITVSSGPIGAPYGGSARVIGTNPICYAVPGKDFTFLLDMATTVHASGYILDRYLAGEKLPPGWMIDDQGRDVLDPAVKYEQPPDKSASVMFGGIVGYKGYGLGVMVDLLTGCLAGDGCSLFVNQTKRMGGYNPTMIIVIDPAMFTDIKAFKERADWLFKAINNSRKAPGVGEILVPGQPEVRAKKGREEQGIPIKDGVWKNIVSSVNRELGIDVEQLVDVKKSRPNQ